MARNSAATSDATAACAGSDSASSRATVSSNDDSSSGCGAGETFDSTVVEQSGLDGIVVNAGVATIGRSASVNNGAHGLSVTASASVASYKDNRFEGNVQGAVSGTTGTATLN